MAKHRRNSRNGNHGHSLPGSLFRGFLVSTLLASVLLLILSAVAYRTADPTKLTSPLSAVALVLSAFFAGFITAAFYRRHGVLVGALSGTVFAVASAILALILAQEGSTVSPARYISYPVIILLATLGGLFGGNRRVRSRTRH